jgi:hypothetical protein
MAMTARGSGLEGIGDKSGAPAKAAVWHPIRTVLTGAFVLVPAHVFVVTSALVLAAGVAGDRMPEGVLAAIGTWSLRFVLGVFGVAAGVVAGLAGAAKRLLDGFEDLLRQRMLSLAAKDDGRLFPAVATSDARARYEAVLDRMIDEMLGRVRVPRFVRRLLRRGLERSMVEEFLADCERRGVAAIGATEVRNWAIANGLPRALAPIRGQITIWRIVSLGPPALIVSLLLLLSLIGTSAAPVHVVGAACGVLGFAVLAAGHAGARAQAHPMKWRIGLGTVGLTIALSPWIWAALLPGGPLGRAFLVFAVTAIPLVEGLRMAFVSASRV